MTAPFQELPFDLKKDKRRRKETSKSNTANDFLRPENRFRGSRVRVWRDLTCQVVRRWEAPPGFRAPRVLEISATLYNSFSQRSNCEFVAATPPQAKLRSLAGLETGPDAGAAAS
mmetsp:Transcript_18569/g.60977  ORF Transcript_18569/g.60977 Transcript_18569/m.60977 type:complete len:115 (+) Transcript_18569:1402-1746(+)